MRRGRNKYDETSSSESEQQEFEQKLYDTVRNEARDQKERLNDQTKKYTAKILLEKHEFKARVIPSSNENEDYQTRKKELERKLEKAISKENERNISPVLRREIEQEEFERQLESNVRQEIAKRRRTPTERQTNELTHEIRCKMHSNLNKRKKDKEKIDFLLRPKRLAYQHELEKDQLHYERELRTNRDEYERDSLIDKRDSLTDKADDHEQPADAGQSDLLDIDYGTYRNDPVDERIQDAYSLKKVEPEWQLRAREEQDDKKKKVRGKRQFKLKVKAKTLEERMKREEFMRQNLNKKSDTSESDE